MENTKKLITVENYKEVLNIENEDEIDFKELNIRNKLSEDFIRKFQDKFNFEYVGMYQELSEDFIREFKDLFEWVDICMYQTLSEDFIREFKDYIDWHYISTKQKLSEAFIREFKDFLDWHKIINYQTLSDEFCEEFNISSNILNSVFNCGEFNRCICIYKDVPTIIHIGCFKGTKYEAIKKITNKYKNIKKRDIYIEKIIECFKSTNSQILNNKKEN